MISRRVRPSFGFTVVELLVALTIVTGALAGIYSILRDAAIAESQASKIMESRSQAQNVADLLATTIQRTIIIPNVPPLVAGPDRDGNLQLTCTVIEPLRPDDPANQWHMVRKLYAWSPEQVGEGIALTQRKLIYGGSKMIWPRIEQGGPDDPASLLQQLHPESVARHLGELQVLFRPIGNPNAEWANQWDGNSSEVLVRIRVTVSSETVERVVIPKVNAAVIGAS